MTPLQVLIAEKIIKINKESDFTVLYICNSNYSKNYHYFKRISSEVSNSYFHFVENSLISFIKFKIFFKLTGYSSLYVSSFHDMYCRYIYSKKENCNIYTYDDGFGNINKKSIFYLDEKMSIKRILVYKFFGIFKKNSDFRKNSLLHYTIYNGEENIIYNTFFVDLFDGYFNESMLGRNNQVRFFIGQPLYVLNKDYNNSFVNSILSKIHIDYYFPHPSESYKIKNKCIIETNLIFEDYIKEYLKDNTECTVEVVSFFSTVLLNLKSQDNIRVKCVADKDLIEDFSEAYEVMSRFGIEIMKVNNL